MLVGPPGCGKSDLVLRLMAHGFELVADDRVDVTDGIASCPGPLAGLLEARGIGIVRLPYRPRARLALIVDLATPADRLPAPREDPDLRVPIVCIDPAAASAVERVVLALDCATGRVHQVAGAFAA